MITAESLRKTYDNSPAVVGSDLPVESGEMFGIIGPSSAGKTTTLKTLAEFVEPTGGSTSVLGYDLKESAMRYKLGSLPEESPLYEDMTMRPYLRFFTGLYDVPRDATDERTGTVLGRFGLEYRDHRLGDMSKKTKRKVTIVRSLANSPDLLIYDEPASGLDPLTTNVVLRFIHGLRDKDKIVVFNTHNLFHVESICGRVVIMNRGRIIARGTALEIRAEHGKTICRVLTTVPLAEILPDDDEIDSKERHVAVIDEMSVAEPLRECAETVGGRVAGIRTDEASLEDIFLRLVRETPTTSEAEGDRGQATDDKCEHVDDEREQRVTGGYG